MDPGSIARSMILVSLTILTLLVSFFVFISLAPRLLAIIQDTAAGNDEVRFASEPLFDKLPRAAYLAGLVLLCIAPAGLILKMNRDLAIGDSRMLAFLCLAGVSLWLFFPITSLSSLSASSVWIVFRMTVLAFLVRRFAASFVFYLSSALVIGGIFGLYFLALSRDSWLWALIAPLVASTGILVYGRLLGRLAYLFDEKPSRRKRKNRRRREIQAVADDSGSGSESKPARSGKRELEDSWDASEAASDSERKRPAKGKKSKSKGYALAEDEPKSDPTPPAVQKSAKRVKGYKLADESLPAQPDAVPMDGYMPVGYEPDSDAAESSVGQGATPFAGLVLTRTPDPKPPVHPFLSGVYTFPLYPDIIPFWVVLSLGLLLISIMVCGMVGVMGQLG
jgi:hypothetical protein